MCDFLCCCGASASEPTNFRALHIEFTRRVARLHDAASSIARKQGGFLQMKIRSVLAAALCALLAAAASAQVTPAAGYTPPDDPPSFKVSATHFREYTYPDPPATAHVHGNRLKR